MNEQVEPYLIKDALDDLDGAHKAGQYYEIGPDCAAELAKSIRELLSRVPS